MTSAISQNNGIYEPIAVKTATPQPQVQNPEDIIVPPPSDSDSGSNTLMNTLTGLALIGSAAYIGYNFFKGRGASFSQTLEAFKQSGGHFEKGIAKLKDDKLFTGVIKYKNEKTGNELFRRYVNGKIVSAGKNADELGFYNPSTTENVLKNWTYDANGKLTNLKRMDIKNGNVLEKDVVRKNVIRKSEFVANGGKYEKGVPINADGTKFNGYIVEYNGNNTLIKEYSAEGKQISERLNTTLQDRMLGKDQKQNYILDEQALDERAKTYSYKFKTLLENITSRFRKTKPASKPQNATVVD